MTSRLPFRLEARATGSGARAAVFRTLHDEVLTPLFMPVGTQATVKAQLPQTLEDSGSQILLANTYHLLLRPGLDVFRSTGGIHKFMSWPRSVLSWGRPSWIRMELRRDFFAVRLPDSPAVTR